MHPLIADHLDAIREFGVARLDVFGLVMTGRFDEESDVDFIVEYPEGYNLGPWAGRHLDLQERLESLLGRRVDLVMATAIRKPRFLRAIQEQRQLLYAA